MCRSWSRSHEDRSEDRDRDRDQCYRASRWCQRCDALIAIDAFARCVDCDRTKIDASCEDRSGDCDCDCDRRYRASRWCRRTVMSQSILSLSLSLPSIFQGRKYFKVKIETENPFRCFGSQIQSTGNAFQFDRIWSNNQTPLFSRKSFPESVWSQF